VILAWRLQLSLKHLDLYLVHDLEFIPPHGDVERLWDDMIGVREAGLTRYAEAALFYSTLDLVRVRCASSRSIGVSNFTLEWLRRIVEMGKVLPAVNQVREPIPLPPTHPLLLPLLFFPGALRKGIADPRPPVQLRVVEGRLGIFRKARHRD